MRSVDPCTDVEDYLQRATYHVNHDAVMGTCRNLINMSTVDLAYSVDDKRKLKRRRTTSFNLLVCECQK